MADGVCDFVNVMHDGSPEVAAMFPQSRSSAITAEQQINGGFAGAKHRGFGASSGE